MVKIGGHTPYIGHTWKLCPYSTAYYTDYYSIGEIGNSTDAYIRANAPAITTTDHLETEGTMSTWVRGVPGFMCWDDACHYFITYGKRYFEA